MGALMNLSSIPFYKVCIDENLSGNISGMLYCGMTPMGVPFSGFEELIFIMENIMDRIRFPQSTMQKRSFEMEDCPECLDPVEIQEAQKSMRRFNADEKRGKLATLITLVQFRQNASWQGLVEWVDRGETFEFESELELIRILGQVV